jgi:SAM-dependent methyltransferase
MSRDHWEQQAENWSRWARRPDFDSYWRYAPAFFELVPPAGERTIDIGCGEGRVTRDLAARGHRVVGVDASPTLIGMAREADSSGAYLRCDAAALPFGDAAFDLAVFYNSLMDFDDMEGSLREAGRVLEGGGRLCVSITHPMQDAGTFVSRAPDAPFVIEGSYLEYRRAFEAAVERDGLVMNFKGWAYPLEAYSRALEKAGFAIEAMREPGNDRPAPSMEPGGERWQRIPVFLMWRAVKTS